MLNTKMSFFPPVLMGKQVEPREGICHSLRSVTRAGTVLIKLADDTTPAKLINHPISGLKVFTKNHVIETQNFVRN